MLNAQSQVIARSVGEVLFDAEVAFCGLNGRMPERHLNLLERGAVAPPLLKFLQHLAVSPARMGRA